MGVYKLKQSGSQIQSAVDKLENNEALQGQVLTADGEGNSHWANPDVNKEYVDSQLNNKQETLVSGQNIKTVNNESVLGSGNISIKSYHTFNNSWSLHGTTEEFCNSIVNDSSAVAGMTYLGTLHCSDLPGGLIQGEATVEIISEGANGKAIHISMTSVNKAPYRWEYERAKVNGAYVTPGWQAYQLELTAGNNITINNKVISAEDTGATSVEVVGNGNAVTAANYDASNRKLTLTKETSFLTQHQSLDGLGNKVDLEIDNDYKVVAKLYHDNILLSTSSVIDLPLESVVVNGEYDDASKKVILTLQNGNTIEFSVVDLVSGLQPEINNNNKLLSDLVDDTNQTHKFTTQQDITKLAGIEAGAQVNVLEGVKVDNVDLAITDKKVNINLSGKQDKLTAGNCIDIENNEIGVVYSERVVGYGDTWNPKTWYAFPSPFNCDDIWTDGENIYYSYGSSQRKLIQNASGEVLWGTVYDWKGLTSFNGRYIWTDGENIYYSYEGNHYILDKATSTWSVKTWNGVPSAISNVFNGSNIWTDGTDTYFSLSYTGTAYQYVLDKATSTWNPKTWNGYTSFYGSNIWTDGENIYYSANGGVFYDEYYHYVLDVATSTWSAKTWNGVTNFTPNNIWTDGENIYLSNTYSKNQATVGNYVLDKATSTWNPKTWNGFDELNGAYIWKGKGAIYYSLITTRPDTETHYELSLLTEKITTLADVAITGNYNDLVDKPDLTTKQDTLVSGTNIKTINSNSILGSGDLIIDGNDNRIGYIPNVISAVYDQGHVVGYKFDGKYFGEFQKETCFICLGQGFGNSLFYSTIGKDSDSSQSITSRTFYSLGTNYGTTYDPTTSTSITKLFGYKLVYSYYNTTLAYSEYQILQVENSLSNPTWGGNPPTTSAVNSALNGKQATLVSGTNIKTINNNSILGSGNIDVPYGMSNPMGSEGDIIVGGASGAPTQLVAGAIGTLLTVNASGVPEWIEHEEVINGKNIQGSNYLSAIKDLLPRNQGGTGSWSQHPTYSGVVNFGTVLATDGTNDMLGVCYISFSNTYSNYYTVNLFTQSRLYSSMVDITNTTLDNLLEGKNCSYNDIIYNTVQDISDQAAATIDTAGWADLRSNGALIINSPSLTNLDPNYEFVRIKLSINSSDEYVKLNKNTTDQYSGLFYMQDASGYYEITVYYDGSKLIFRCTTFLHTNVNL